MVMFTSGFQEEPAGGAHVRKHRSVAIDRTAARPAKAALHYVCWSWSRRGIEETFPATVVPGAPRGVAPWTRGLGLCNVPLGFAGMGDGQHGRADRCTSEDGELVAVVVVTATGTGKEVLAVPVLAQVAADLARIAA